MDKIYKFSSMGQFQINNMLKISECSPAIHLWVKETLIDYLLNNPNEHGYQAIQSKISPDDILYPDELKGTDTEYYLVTLQSETYTYWLTMLDYLNKANTVNFLFDSKWSVKHIKSLYSNFCNSLVAKQKLEVILEMDKFTWYELQNEASFLVESHYLKHCLGHIGEDHFKDVQSGKYKVLSLRSNNSEKSVITIKYNVESKVVIACVGHHNTKPGSYHKKYLKAIQDKLNLVF